MDKIQEMLGTGGMMMETNVDIVFAIDATRSMQDTIDMVKDSALSFYDNLEEFMSVSNGKIGKLRIKVIWFRDFYYDGEFAFGESRFFALPEEKAEFKDFVKDINEAGGGDIPETSLEALTIAMRSDFTQEGDKKRHLIILFTDAPAHAFEDHEELVAQAKEKGCELKIYPANMPSNLVEFYNAWEGNEEAGSVLASEGGEIKLDPKGRRLVLFAPNDYPWNDMEVELSNVIRKDIEPGKGGSELDMEEVYSLIAYSMK